MRGARATGVSSGLHLKQMGRGLWSLPALLAILGVGTVPAMPIRADTGGNEKSTSQRKIRLFNIPAQPLIAALQSYSAVTGYQVICDTRLAAGRRSKPVIGLFTPETALRMLLDGTALTIRYTGPQDITLAPAGSDGLLGDPALGTNSGDAGVMVLDTLHVDVAIGAEHRSDFSEYGMIVRSAVRRALANDPATSHRIYDLQLDIFVGPGGVVRRPHLLSSTGTAQLDAAIVRVLGSTVIGKEPPPGLPQPVRIAIVAI